MTSPALSLTTEPAEPGITHPRSPLINDDSAVLLDQAIVGLTIVRSPTQLGDCLADLHAMASLLAQLHAWLPITVAGARRQGHSWPDIADQLTVSPMAARTRYGGRQRSRSRSHE